MLVELDPVAGAGRAAELAARIGATPDVTAWPVFLSGRGFIVVSGDEALVPGDAVAADPAVIGVHSTSATGRWLVERENGVVAGPVEIGTGVVGGRGLWCAAGPCALESVADTVETGLRLRAQGVSALRMGLFKPRSSPYRFQGKGLAGLPGLREVRESTGLPVVTEVIDPRDVAAVAEVADCLQVDTRNMTNRALLTELGEQRRPVLLMRGLRSTVADWLGAAEFLVSRGNPHVVLCARGVATFDDSLAFAPDYGAILAVRERCGLPIVFDPSHSTGKLAAVAPAALAACAFGVDGLLIESFAHPERLYRPGDGDQMYPPDGIGALLDACRGVRDTAAAVAGDFAKGGIDCA